MATYEERQTAALASTVAWLEDELRDARAGTTKLTQALEQSQAEVWELKGRLHRLEEAVTAIVPQLAVLPDLEGQLRGTKDVLSRVHEHGIATETRLSELVRQVDAAAERERQAVNELSHRLDAVERHTQSAAARFDVLDEGGRRAMESITLARQRSDEVARAVDTLDTRLARVIETGSRTEHEFTRIGAELDGLRKQDGATAERVQVYSEMIKRLEGQLSQVAADVVVKQDVFEQIELNRVETHRLEEQIAALEAAVDGLRDRDDEAMRQLGVLDGRQKGFQERLLALLSDFATHSAQVSDQFQRLHQFQERLKRRQVEELEREIREMRIHAFRPSEEQ